MADRPTASTSRAGRPRMRSKSAHLSSHIPVAPKTGKLRTTSEQRALTKSKGAGKGKKTLKKSSKPVVVVSSDSDDLEVDFLNYSPISLMRYPLTYLKKKNPTHLPTLQLRNNRNRSIS